MKSIRGPQQLSYIVRPRHITLLQGQARSSQQVNTNITAHRPTQPTHLPLFTCKSPVYQHTRLYATDSLRRTALYDLHLRHAGKMVPFGGFSMPVQYGDHSIKDSHLFTRSHASLFDVSHMVQHRLTGRGATALLERITPSAPAALEPNTSGLSCLLGPSGGIIDDSIITRLGPTEFYFVTNAARRADDLAFLAQSIDEFRANGGESIEHTVLDDYALVALQGPMAHALLKPLLATPDYNIDTLLFGQCTSQTLSLASGTTSAPVLISRGGYTGEDGFEISVPASDAVSFVETLLSTAGPEKLRLAGLGARDTLRLEAGMCLYGHDISESTTPVEAALSWVIPKDRRASGGFNGADVIIPQLTPKAKGGKGVDRRRVGLMMAEGAPPAREGAVVEGDKSEIGNVTSGGPSPSLGRNIAMGYVSDGWHKQGTEVEVVVRGKRHAAKVTKMPFVPSKYWKGGVSPG